MIWVSPWGSMCKKCHFLMKVVVGENGERYEMCPKCGRKQGLLE
jgi:hypothetical protein